MTSDTLFEIPDTLTANKILAVQPHYDDNDIAAGGTLAALAENGASITYLTVTDDLVGVLDQSLTDEEMTVQLRKEQECAGDVIGVTEQFWLGYADAGRFDYFDVRQDVIKHIRMLRPDFVFTCDPWTPYEAHQDHIRTGIATAEAVILYNMPRLTTDPEVDENFESYELTGIVFYATAHPNKIFDISKTREKIDAYQAQFTSDDMTLLHLYLDYLEQKYAKDDKFSHGEPLKVLRTSQLHGSPDTWRS
jgi:LmbE family N-acetylglucosaminyl deacetylase